MANWQQALSEIRDFVSQHPEITLEEKYTHIPKEVRPELFSRLRNVGKAFIEEKCMSSLNEAKLLSENYLKVKKELIASLGLKDISFTTSFDEFLDNPTDALVAYIKMSLFDLLKDAIGAKSFEELNVANIESYIKTMLEPGYEKWVVLSLVQLLNTDEVLGISPVELPSREQFVHTSYRPDDTMCAFPQKTGSILFKNRDESSFITSDIVAYSAELHRYIATSSQIGHALSVAQNASNNREWLSYNDTLPHDIYLTNNIVSYPPLTLIYIADDPNEISLTADAEKICRPDMAIVCTVKNDWYQEERFKKLRLFCHSLNPRLGTYVLSKEPMPSETDSGVHILSVSYDKSKLEPIITALSCIQAVK